MSKVNDFLTEAGLFFLATVDGDQPKLRPLGLHFEMDDKVLFGVGDFKDVYKQLQANPKAEICAFKDGVWLRVAGELIRDDRLAAKKHMLEQYPDLQAMYSAEDDNTEVLYFKSAEATFSSFTAPPRTVKF